MATPLATYSDPTISVPQVDVNGRPIQPEGPNIADLYKKLTDLTGAPVDYSGVAEAAKARAAAAKRDFAAGMAMRMMGGKALQDPGEMLMHSGVQEGQPLRANLADVGYSNPDTGAFVENPLLQRDRAIKLITGRIDSQQTALHKFELDLLAEGRLNEAMAARKSREQLGEELNKIRQQLADERAKHDRATEGTAARRADNAEAFGKPLSFQQQKELLETQGHADMQHSLVNTFKPSYTASVPYFGGDLANYWVNQVGGPASKNVQEQAGWWGDYKKNSELFERHKMFGAALTPGEQAQWKGADINPNMSAAEIQRRLEVRAALADKAANGWKQMLSANSRQQQIDSVRPQPLSPPAPVQQAPAQKLPPLQGSSKKNYRMDSQGNLIEE